jgi:hypothetical protein
MDKLTFLYLLKKETFLDHLKDDIAEVGEDFARFFSTIKEYTYDYLVERWGETTTNLLLLALVFLLIMWVATVLINK